MDNALVVKSNDLVEASYRLSVAEQRLVLTAISKVDRFRPISDQEKYEVTAAELAQVCGNHIKTAYRDLQSACEQLFERRVTVYTDGKKIVTRWVQAVIYSEGSAELMFSAPIAPYLTNLKAQFTQYCLSDVARMSSAYAIRLYELLVQWGNAKPREVEVEWLREVLQLDGKYPAIKDFKLYVIEKAVQQINEFSPLSVSYSQRKTGRRITHLIFKFQSKVDKGRKKPSPQLTPDYITANAKPGETWQQATDRLKRKNTEKARATPQ